MATIYLGKQTSLNRKVAIKFLSAEFLWDPQVRQLFDQESMVVAQLSHPNIIHIIDRGFTEGGRPFFVMEYAEGEDLSAVMRKPRLSMPKQLDLIMQICKGLTFAHKNGIIHRDIKPANLLINSDGHLKILDFGIAWLIASGRPDSDEIYGTPDYMSPEQFNAPDTVTLLSDIYSLGAVMYHLLIGKTQSSNTQGWQKAMTSLPPKLAEIIRQCLQIDPLQRPQSADEIRLSLLLLLNGTHLGETLKAEAKTMVGKAIDQFILLDVIKRDQYGSVYLFEQKSRHQLLVIKKRTKSEAGLAEAKLLSTLKHPNIIKILGISKNDNAFIVVMQHLTGGSLQDRLSRPYAGDRFIDFGIQFCNAMEAAHRANILHGNLRPSNVLFDQKEQIRITDFGFDEHYRENRKDWYQPEIRGDASVERDIYAAGAIFHHMLTGEPLKFDHRRIQSSAGFDQLDSRLQKLLRNMLETDSEGYCDRFKTITHQLNGLQGKLPDPWKHSRQIRVKRRAILGVLLTILAAISGYLVFNPEPLHSIIDRLDNWWEIITQLL